MPFVNNYGVWEDEFRELGLAHTLNTTWKDALCYFGEGQEVGGPSVSVLCLMYINADVHRAATKLCRGTPAAMSEVQHLAL